MAKVILYVALSSDGYLADRDGGVDWLSQFEGGDEDCGYNEFYNSVDALAMGSKTYEQILTFGDWPYPGKPTYVFTQRDLKTERDDVFFVSDDVKDFFDSRGDSFQRLWLVGGAELATSFHELGLIDECITTVVPVGLGEGIALPEDICGRELVEVGSKVFDNGIVQRCHRRIVSF